jgi:hypothetical protein
LGRFQIANAKRKKKLSYFVECIEAESFVCYVKTNYAESYSKLSVTKGFNLLTKPSSLNYENYEKFLFHQRTLKVPS